jgi:hypothetical protein
MDLGEIIEGSDVDLSLLTAPFPKAAIKQRTVGGGRSLSYVEGHTVIHRLNAATHYTWDLEILALESMTIGNQTVLRAHVRLSIPGLGAREHVGVQSIADRAGEDLVKGAVTDALKKAATLFGVGLELYGPDYGSGELDAVETAAKRVLSSAGKNDQQTASLYDIGTNRQLDAEQVRSVALAIVGRSDVEGLDRETATVLWQFLKKASDKDIRDAVDAGNRERAEG